MGTYTFYILSFNIQNVISVLYSVKCRLVSTLQPTLAPLTFPAAQITVTAVLLLICRCAACRSHHHQEDV